MSNPAVGSSPGPIWLVAGLTLLVGCSRPEPDLSVELSPNAYAVSVKILEYSEKGEALFSDYSEETIATVMGHKGVAACTRIWFRVSRATSSAMSASRMADSAACRFSTEMDRFEIVRTSRFCTAPTLPRDWVT